MTFFTDFLFIKFRREGERPSCVNQMRGADNLFTNNVFQQ